MASAMWTCCCQLRRRSQWKLSASHWLRGGTASVCPSPQPLPPSPPVVLGQPPPKPLPVCLWRFSPCAMLCMAASRTLLKCPFSLSTSVFLHCIMVTIFFFPLSHLCYCFVWSHLYWTNSCASSPCRHTEANVDYVHSRLMLFRSEFSPRSPVGTKRSPLVLSELSALPFINYTHCHGYADRWVQHGGTEWREMSANRLQLRQKRL